MNRNAKILNNILTGAIIALMTAIAVVSLIAFFSTPAKAEHSVGFAAGSTRGLGAT